MMAAVCLLSIRCPLMASYHTLLKHSHSLCFLCETVFVIWCCYYISYYCGRHPLFFVKDPTLQHQSFLSLCLSSSLSVCVSLSLSLSLSWALSSSLAARLAGCQLLIYTGNILAMMAPYGLRQTEYNKQEIRFQTGWLAYVKRKRNDSNHYYTFTIKDSRQIPF